MYIVCVILCLFSALSRRVGALQISIIIIVVVITPSNREIGHSPKSEEKATAQFIDLAQQYITTAKNLNVGQQFDAVWNSSRLNWWSAVVSRPETLHHKFAVVSLLSLTKHYTTGLLQYLCWVWPETTPHVCCSISAESDQTLHYRFAVVSLLSHTTDTKLQVCCSISAGSDHRYFTIGLL